MLQGPQGRVFDTEAVAVAERKDPGGRQEEETQGMFLSTPVLSFVIIS